MTMVDRYPDPFARPAEVCPMTPTATLGPCYVASPLRRDVSEGLPGLPVRLAFQLVDRSCAPISNAQLEIWHTGFSGFYSAGPTDRCTLGDPEAMAATYGRGGQVSDADGTVAFHTCFPGWYSGRAIHIHLQVVPPGGGRAQIISQVFFQPDLTDEIFASHPDYRAFGEPDVTNDRDGIYRRMGEASVLEHARMPDGAMLAWKRIVVG